MTESYEYKYLKYKKKYLELKNEIEGGQTSAKRKVQMERMEKIRRLNAARKKRENRLKEEKKELCTKEGRIYYDGECLKKITKDDLKVGDKVLFLKEELEQVGKSVYLSTPKKYKKVLHR